jgi:hypothetical protein
MTQLATDVLANLIRHKRLCLEHLRAVGEKQLALVRAGSMTELLDLLAAKQPLLLRLQAVERELDPFRSQDPDARRWRTPDARQRCAAELAQCEALLAQIVRREKESERELVRRRDETAAQLETINSAGHARQAYLASYRESLSQLDLASGGT